LQKRLNQLFGSNPDVTGSKNITIFFSNRCLHGKFVEMLYDIKRRAFVKLP